MQAKGKLQIKVDDSQLEASIIFVPHKDGQVWNKPKLLNLLEEKGIVEGIDKKAIDKALQECARAAEQAGGSEEVDAGEDGAGDGSAGDESTPRHSSHRIQRVVAKGKPPEAGEPGYFNWKELPVPEEISDDGERVLKTAPPPDITRTRTKKEKVQKKVAHKQKLPFGKPKEEVVEKLETKTWEEPVNVDPKVLQSGWAEQGQTLAEWVEGGEGKKGTSVYGLPLEPSGGMDEELLGGRGVKVGKESVVAEESGFFRRGSGWAEIIPFRRHKWEVGAGKDKATCLLSFSPGDEDATPPTAIQIRDSAIDLGFPEEELIPEAAISTLIHDSISSNTPLENVSISKDRDSFFTIEASKDRLKGLLTMRKGSGKGKPLVLKEVGAAIKKSGFKGMDFEKIKKDLLEFYKGPDRELESYVLAEGKAPVRGGDRSLEFTCTWVEKEELERLKGALPDSEEVLEAYPSLADYPLQSVDKMAYVKKDSVVGEIAAGEKGEEGADVYGKKIDPPPGNDPLISFKENIQLREDKLYALEEGILDLIETEKESAETGEAGETDESPEEAETDEAEGTEDKERILRVRAHSDSVVHVQLAEDKMKAFLTLSSARGTGEPLTLEKVNRVLDENGVKKGINSTAISRSIEAAKRGEEVTKVPVAEGIPPIEPGESRLKFSVKRASGKSLTLKEDGRADYKNQDKITAVEKDQTIGVIISSDTQPKDGWDVTGTPLKAKEPPPLAIDVGENIRQEEQENGDIKLYAESSGELYYDQKRLEVHTVHKVDGNVDMSSGNIDFPGEVQVKGNVHEGFYVMAGGDVKIAGAVEASLVSSGQDVTIVQGVVGGGKAAVRAKQHIETSFAEQATLLSVGDIRLKNSCLRCNVKCNGTVKLAPDKGDLIGGTINTRHGIEAHNIGNEKNVKTSISFGQDYLVADQIQQHEKKIEKIKEYTAKLDTMMKRYEKAGERKKLDSARREKLKYLKMIEKRSMHLFTLRERYEEHFESKIAVHGKIFPGVVLESHGRFYEVTAGKEKVVFSFNLESGKIEEQALEKE
ncbi:MAG: flagellar assembly protein A [Spirochaetaceae bacterium]